MTMRTGWTDADDGGTENLDYRGEHIATYPAYGSTTLHGAIIYFGTYENPNEHDLGTHRSVEAAQTYAEAFIDLDHAETAYEEAKLERDRARYEKMKLDNSRGTLLV